LSLILNSEHIVRLEKTHDCEAFDCGNNALNGYLREQARQDADEYEYVDVVHVLIQPNSQKVLGFYTLAASQIPVQKLPAEWMRQLSGDESFPVENLPIVLLERLAVDKTVSGQKAGTFLLMNALNRSFEASQLIGMTSVVVNAKDEREADFYRHFNFISLQQEPLRLVFLIKQIEKMFT
jgi:predicted GNAT family N-acyltransferase